MKTRTNVVKVEMSLELKYCERCGGLWLRPAGGGQVYCVACASEMGEMPPVSHEMSSAGRRVRLGTSAGAAARGQAEEKSAGGAA
jgi:hypothetical protein